MADNTQAPRCKSVTAWAVSQKASGPVSKPTRPLQHVLPCYPPAPPPTLNPLLFPVERMYRLLTFSLWERVHAWEGAGMCDLAFYCYSCESGTKLTCLRIQFV